MSLRLLTANLYWGRVEPHALDELLDEYRPDAVAVQELRPPLAEVLAARFPYGDLDPGDGARGMGLALSRKAPVSHLPLPNRDALVAHLHPSDWPMLSETLEVINVHITALTVPPPWQTAKMRSAELEALDAYLEKRPQIPCVLIGDLNSPPFLPGYKRLKRYFTDAAETVAAKTGKEVSPTWGLPSGGRRWVRLDHALVADVGVRDVHTLEIPGSDHSGILVEFEL